MNLQDINLRFVLFCDIVISTGENQMKDREFPFRFPTLETKRQFKIVAATIDKSMNQLLGELVIDYLRKIKGITE